VGRAAGQTCLRQAAIPAFRPRDMAAEGGKASFGGRRADLPGARLARGILRRRLRTGPIQTQEPFASRRLATVSPDEEQGDRLISEKKQQGPTAGPSIMVLQDGACSAGFREGEAPQARRLCHGSDDLGRLIRADWHIHTHLSDCGHAEATPAAVISAAQQAGLEEVGFTDHVILPEHRERPRILRRQVPRAAEGLRVYVGCEADMQSPTRASIDAGFASELDFVVMSASHLYDEGVSRPEGLTARQTAALCTELMLAAIASGLADIIAHPFGVPASPFTFEEIAAEADHDGWMRVAEAAARAGVAIEYNPVYLRYAPEVAHWLFPPLLDAGVKLALNSDAHHPANVGCRGPGYASDEELRAEGLTEDRVWRIEDRVSAGRPRRLA